MKSIKLLLSLFAMLTVTMGAWGQVTTITLATPTAPATAVCAGRNAGVGVTVEFIGAVATAGGCTATITYTANNSAFGAGPFTSTATFPGSSGVFNLPVNVSRNVATLQTAATNTITVTYTLSANTCGAAMGPAVTQTFSLNGAAPTPTVGTPSITGAGTALSSAGSVALRNVGCIGVVPTIGNSNCGASSTAFLTTSTRNPIFRSCYCCANSRKRCSSRYSYVLCSLPKQYYVVLEY